MRALDPALAARLASGATTLCACWRIDRRDGVSLGFTDHDEAIAFDGVSFAATGALAASAVEQTAGMAADTVEISGALRSDAIAERDIARGLYDQAVVRRWLVDWREPTLRLLTFHGTLGAVTRAGAAFRAEIVGPSAALNRPIGRAYLPGCDATLGDARCGVDATAPAYSGEGAVVAVEGAADVVADGPGGFAPGWFTHGALNWLSGDNAGQTVAVAADTPRDGGRALRLWRSPAAPAVAGDRFRLVAGCDRQAGTCRDKFANILNFRGFPHMPGEDWIIGPPGRGEAHGGGSMRG